MGWNSSTSGVLQKNPRLSKSVYNQSQKEILQKSFEQNPYLDKDTKKQLAEETGIPEYKIRIWFKNRRAKKRQLESKWPLEKDQSQELPWTQDARQEQTSITRSQSNILVQASDGNQFSDITTRKILAKQTAIWESRILNRRSLYSGQSRSKPVNSLADSPDGTEDLIVQQHQINLSTLTVPSSNSLSKNQTSLPALFPSHVSSVPCVSQGPSVMVVQPIQTVQGGEDPPSTLTLKNCPPILLTAGRDLSNTHTPFQPQNKEKCEIHKEQIAPRVLQMDYSQLHPEHKGRQSQDMDQTDMSYIIQRWEECCQALIAKWNP